MVHGSTWTIYYTIQLDLVTNLYIKIWNKWHLHLFKKWLNKNKLFSVQDSEWPKILNAWTGRRICTNKNIHTQTKFKFKAFQKKSIRDSRIQILIPENAARSSAKDDSESIFAWIGLNELPAHSWTREAPLSSFALIGFNEFDLTPWRTKLLLRRDDPAATLIPVRLANPSFSAGDVTGGPHSTVWNMPELDGGGRMVISVGWRRNTKTVRRVPP